MGLKYHIEQIVQTSTIMQTNVPMGTSIRRSPVFGGHQYSAGTSFRHLRALRNSPWKFNTRTKIICNYTICNWPTTSSNILIVHHNVAIGLIGGLKVIICIVLSAEYWCSNGMSVSFYVYVCQFFTIIPSKSSWIRYNFTILSFYTYNTMFKNYLTCHQIYVLFSLLLLFIVSTCNSTAGCDTWSE